MKELRRLSYCDAHVYVLGYAVNKPTSLENVSMQWIPEITTIDPDAVIVLCGFHADMRESQENCVSTEEAQAVSAQMALGGGAVPFGWWLRSVVGRGVVAVIGVLGGDVVRGGDVEGCRRGSDGGGWELDQSAY